MSRASMTRIGVEVRPPLRLGRRAPPARCGGPLVHHRGLPQPLAVSAGAASQDALAHVAGEEQRKALELMKCTSARAELGKWPVEEAAEIAALAERLNWPASARSYVAGRGACGGLISGPGGVRVFQQNKEVTRLMKRVNAALGRWADRHAPRGFGWTSLQMNFNTSSEWHSDHKNEGPSLLLVVGSHQGM